MCEGGHSGSRILNMASPAKHSIVAPQTSEAQIKACSLLFYRAVRDLKPVWMLEDMRTMETFYWEDDASSQPRTYSPSEALLYAIVHDHQAYARHLLSHHANEALAKPGERFCCCPASSSSSSAAPHLAMAVRYDRRYILGLILREAHRMPPGGGSVGSRRGNSGVGAGGFHTEDGKTSPLHLACELLRPEAVVMLLGNGASPRAEDHNGRTPLDILLQRLDTDSSKAGNKNAGDATRQCLDNMLMFYMPEINFKMKSALSEKPDFWAKLLGEDTFNYLAGKSPAPLVLLAMQTILKQLSPARFSDSLHELPIPLSLKPTGLPRSQHESLKVLL